MAIFSQVEYLETPPKRSLDPLNNNKELILI
jgi:hypothetical protein